MFCARCTRTSAVRQRLPLIRQFHAPALLRSAEPKLSSLANDAPEQPSTQRSVCPEGTILSGLSYTKGNQDPVAKKDEEYPEWLWSCLDVLKKADSADADAGDEFSKSQKQRRLAAKRQKSVDAQNPEALAPKIPIQHQSINLPGEEGGSVLDNIAAAQKRQELQKAMRKERKAKIKESNYLKSM
ncbi:hypothetical protein E4U41_007185 [Claviceps citrina]|nr:hypothetical protein E4U41_007185 [Claviceps citrina]